MRLFHFLRNYATDEFNRTTILVSSAGQRYFENVLVNEDNDYEMATINRTQYVYLIHDWLH